MRHRMQGAGPVTVAEFSLGASDGADFVDVSLVDGFNLPVRISNNKGCPTSDCPVDLNPNCQYASLRLFRRSPSVTMLIYNT